MRHPSLSLSLTLLSLSLLPFHVSCCSTVSLGLLRRLPTTNTLEDKCSYEEGEEVRAMGWMDYGGEQVGQREKLCDILQR